MVADRPRRPRLADHVLARRHVQGQEEFVVLHDERRGDQLQVSASTWAVLRCADGTRDAHGIAAAAARLGARVTSTSVEGVLAQLEARGALAEGAPEHAPDVASTRARGEDLAALRVEALPNYRFVCDSSGGCCRSYGSVLLTPDDMARARATLPDYAVGPVPPHRWFTPAKGSAPHPLSVPVGRGGGCGFLGPDELCEIHRVGGEHAKPAACQAFPTLACSDGVAVRLSVTPECACVLESPCGPQASGFGAEVVCGGDLPQTTVISELAADVPISASQSWPRAEVRTWVLARLEMAPDQPDLAAWCWSTAASLDSQSVTTPQLERPFGALRERAAGLLRRMQSWRAPEDWVVQSLQWLVGTLALLDRLATNDTLFAVVSEAEAVAPEQEQLYLRASLWGYVGFDRAPVQEVMRTHAWVLWLARTMAATPLAPQRPGTQRPALALSTLTMLLRGHGLARAWRQS